MLCPTVPLVWGSFYHFPGLILFSAGLLYLVSPHGWCGRHLVPSFRGTVSFYTFNSKLVSKSLFSEFVKILAGE